MELVPGEVVLTATGRKTTPFPKNIDMTTSRRVLNTLKRVDHWLMQNALAEAQARGDRFNARQFECALKRPFQASKDAAEVYLFSPASAHPIPRPFLRALR